MKTILTTAFTAFHITTGGVTITENADGTSTITFDAAFSLDGAPDPQVGFGKDGTFSSTSNLGPRKSITGAQSYIVPAGLDISDFNELYIWCVKFAVPLGVAQLTSS